jgi:hypothetical protein
MHAHPFGNHACQWLQCCESWCVHALECEVPWQHAVITELVNPITRSVVQVVPPREISARNQFEHLAEAFRRFCEDAWREGYKDPPVYEEIPPEASGIR